jgi:putative ABC transport system permease protein
VGAVMLIACANVSNLLLARAMVRRREVSIRAALGAARSRVVRQLLTESLLLSVIAGAAGVLLSMYGLHFYAQSGPRGLIHGTQPELNGWVTAFATLLSVGASAIFGLAPAIETSRMDLTDALKEGSRGSTGGRRLLRESMVAVEVAVSLILVIGAGLLVRSFARLQRADPGFRSDNLLAAHLVLPLTMYKQPAQRVAFANSLVERVAALPGVRSAGTVEFLPFAGGYGRGPFQIVGHPRDRNLPSPVVTQSRTSSGYFESMGIPLLRGRRFTLADDHSPQSVAVVDDALVKQYFGALDPIGMQVMITIPNVTCTVVGVVGNVKYRDLAGPPAPTVYYSSPQMPSGLVDLAIRTAGNPLSLAGGLRHEIAALDASLPVAAVMTMDQALADSLVRQRFSIELMAVFAGIAALLAAIGIYGVLAYLVDQRRREVGIRLALGARPADILALVLRQGSLPVATGVALGIGGALALTRILKSQLYQVSATDPLTFALVPVGLAAVALMAMLIPARRAARVDPVKALRQE